MRENEKLTVKEKIEIAVQTGLQLIPTVGGPLSTAYFGVKQEKRFKRIESFYDEFSREMEQIGYRFASIQSHDQESLIAIIEELNDKVEHEQTNEKRNFFKKFLKNTLTIPIQNNFDERRFFLDALANMTLLECELLILFSQNSNQPVLVGSISKPGTEQYAIVGGIGRLKMFGFLMSGINSMSIGGGVDQSLNENVQISNFGQRFVSFCLMD